jgi:hypothetical protein
LFLLTDDANAVGEALALHGQHRWMYVDRPRFRGAEGGWENQLPSGNPKFEIVAMMGIFKLVKRCGITFVFGSSSFSEYIQGLLLERDFSNNNTAPTLIRLDTYGGNPNNSATVAISRNYDLTENTNPSMRMTQVTAIASQPAPHCHLWEENTDEWWSHHPEWEVSLENDTHYCFSPIHNEEKAKLFREIYDIQMSPAANCSNVISKVQIGSGWGADISNIIDGLYMALDARQPMQVFVPERYGHWHYAALKHNGSNPTCPRKDIFCYFLNLTHCPPNPEREAPFSQDKHWVSHFDVPGRWLSQYITRPQSWLRRASHEFARERLLIHNPHQSISNRSNDLPPNSTFDNNTRTLPGVVALDRVTKTPVHIPTCVVIHVRRTDVVLHGVASRKYLAISEYLDALWNQSHYKPSDDPALFLLTDDANAVGEALALHGQHRWMYVDRPRFRGAEGGWENQLPSGNPKFEIVAMMGIFKLVKRCGTTFVFGSSSFSDYIKGLLLERDFSNNNTAPTLIWLDTWGGNPNNSATVAISKTYQV